MSDKPLSDEQINEKRVTEIVKLVHSEYMESFKFVKETSANGIQALYLLNGGAIVALLAFLGQAVGKAQPGVFDVAKLMTNIAGAFPWYISGLVLAACTSLFAYLNASSHNNAHMSGWALLGWWRKENEDDRSEYVKRTNARANIAIGSAILSLMMFAVGCLYVYNAIISSLAPLAPK